MLLGDRERHIEAIKGIRLGCRVIQGDGEEMSVAISPDHEHAERIVDALAAIPPEIDEEMVERAARGIWQAVVERMGSAHLRWEDTNPSQRAHLCDDARAALEAAFTPPAQPGQREETT